MVVLLVVPAGLRVGRGGERGGHRLHRVAFLPVGRVEHGVCHVGGELGCGGGDSDLEAVAGVGGLLLELVADDAGDGVPLAGGHLVVLLDAADDGGGELLHRTVNRGGHRLAALIGLLRYLLGQAGDEGVAAVLAVAGEQGIHVVDELLPVTLAADVIEGILDEHIRIVVILVAEQAGGGADYDVVVGDSLAVIVGADTCGVIEQARLVVVVFLPDLLLRFDSVEDADDPGVAEDSVEVAEQVVAHEAATHRLDALQDAGNGEDFLRVERDHLAVLVLADDGEEVEHAADTRLAVLIAARAACGEGRQVARILVVDFEGAGGIKVEDVCGFLADELHGLLAGFRVGNGSLLLAGVLGTEGGLDVGGWALHVGEHEDAAPLGNRHADGELTDGQCDCLVVLLNCVGYLLEVALTDLVAVLVAVDGIASVADGGDDLVLAEHAVGFE